MEENKAKIKFPAEDTIYDYRYDDTDVAFHPWSETFANFEIDAKY